MIGYETTLGKCEHQYLGVITEDEYVAFKLYVDGRLRVGERYWVRVTDQAHWLFSGLPLALVSIQPAEYCYRFEFALSPYIRGAKERCIYTDSWDPAGLALLPVSAAFDGSPPWLDSPALWR